MPEFTWQAALVWFGVLSGAASVTGVLMAVMSGRQTPRLQADMHAATQATLSDLAQGFRESQQSLGEILKRMDQRADERQRQMVSAIQALRG
jgi:hypothetical protein